MRQYFRYLAPNNSILLDIINDVTLEKMIYCMGIWSTDCYRLIQIIFQRKEKMAFGSTASNTRNNNNSCNSNSNSYNNNNNNKCNNNKGKKKLRKIVSPTSDSSSRSFSSSTFNTVALYASPCLKCDAKCLRICNGRKFRVIDENNRICEEIEKRSKFTSPIWFSALKDYTKKTTKTASNFMKWGLSSK